FLIPFLFFPFDFWTITAVIAITTLSLFRLLLILPAPKFIFFHDKKRYSLIVLAILSVVFIVQLIYLYDQVWRRQYLFFSDWGMFVEPALNTLRGDFMTEYRYNPGTSFLSHHFMPGFFIWFIPLMWLFPYPQTIMVVGALILGGSALLIYYFARLRELPPVMAGLCGLIYLLYPTISNYNLSQFYGFHVIYLFIPVFILFCCFYEREKWLAAFLIFIFSLSIKETVGAFWVGWGICQFLSGHRKRGVIYALISGVYLLCCIKLIIPAFSPANQYMYGSFFDFLGGNLLEIALSPILRPAAFWGALISPKKIMLLILIGIPLFPAIFSRPLWLGCCAVTVVFVFLHGIVDLINLQRQYTVEMSVLFCLAFVAAVSGAYRNGSGSWSRILSIYLPEVKSRHLAWALLASGLLASISAHCFLAENLYGKNSHRLRNVVRRPDRTSIRKKIIELVPSGVMIGTDERSGALMIASGLTVAKFTYYPHCDFYFYDLSDLDGGVNCDFHQKLLKDPEFGLVWYSSISGGNYYLFQRGVVSKYPNPLRRLSEDEWNASGPELKLPDNNHLFAVKVQPKETAGKLHLNLTIGSRTVLDKFYQVTVYASDGQNTQYFKFLFANGFVTPAEVKPGDVFQIELPLPPSWEKLHSCGCKIENK
ncbi:MAG: DUF2079 domain-containing protein, partial [Victivallaceae bacterium]|nr:DUF2079 domain-containing protein [Victivallaceae bacterium]